MNEKEKRQRALLDLVSKRAVSSQSELVTLLQKRGLSATQTSVSRDARELGLVKLEGRYVPASDVAQRGMGNGQASPLSGIVISAEPVGANLIVVRTTVGAANAAGVHLDGLRLDDICGTIAGDDTIFIAVRSRLAQGRVLARLRAAAAPKGQILG